ncbi:sedoheptulokinase [Hyperolius riggenbachi]|uniref:sedoheptulokinase n=1 Tax=Hyperolius riggenbachi TaxID=752182 RepID=UPI0035A37291
MEFLRGPMVLGIDVGTSSVKAVLLDARDRSLLHTHTIDTRAAVPSECGAQGREQDVGKIIKALNECVMALPRECLQQVARIGVCGQMHGVVLWKAKKGCHWINTGDLRVFEPWEVSRLVTWEDGRCSKEFLAALPPTSSHLSLASGFGCVTLLWYLKNRVGIFREYDAAGTIQDYVVAMLCDLKIPVMSDQNAASWGYYNTRCKSWDVGTLQGQGFPIDLLPDVEEGGNMAGDTSYDWCGIPQGARVGVALGDFQCLVFSAVRQTSDAVLNISTSAQLTFCMPEEWEPRHILDPADPVTYFPYMGHRYLAVAASLNGGNVLASFVEMLVQWTAELGVEISDSTIYSKVINAALSEEETQLTICPTLFGERHNPTGVASASNITPGGFSLGHVTRALCHGIIENLHTMMPSHKLEKAGATRIVGSGSALARNEVLRQEVERAFTLPVVYEKDVNSAVGVGIIMCLSRR